MALYEGYVRLKHRLETIKLVNNIYYFDKTVSDEEEGIVGYRRNGIAYKDDIDVAGYLPFNEIKTIRDVFLVPTTLIDWYKTNGLGKTDGFERVVREVIQKTNDPMFIKSIKDMSAYVLVRYDFGSEAIFDFDGNPLEHVVRYSMSIYMVTDKEYDLDGLYAFLSKQNSVFIQKGGIQEIPWYNSDGNGTRYINFYVRMTAEQLKMLNKTREYDFGLPSEVIDISQFKKSDDEIQEDGEKDE